MGNSRKRQMTKLHLLAGAATAFLLIATSAQAASEADQIRKLRAASNTGLAAHQAEAGAGHLAEDARILASSGVTLDGAAAMRAAFAQSFADPQFVTYVRTPTKVEVGGRVAAETGRWRGVWKDRELSGPYIARWEVTPNGWRAKSEMYVPTACKGSGCPR